MKQVKKPVYLSTKDYFKTGEKFDLLFDKKNQMLITHPQPEPKALKNYYDHDQYLSHSDNKKGLIPFLYYTVKRIALKKKTRIIKRHVGKTGTLLDIGTGTGDFLNYTRQKGWDPYGVEPIELARGRALKKGLNVFRDLSNIPQNNFDAITLWHVLEHLPNLDSTIASIISRLKPGGILVIAAPNYRSFDANHYNEYWAAFDTPRHLWHFSKETMKLIFPENVKLKKIQPMIFDSYYVSLLSEKYKKGKPKYLNAFWIGLRSNLAAWKTKEYSSLIYCFKKDE